MVAWSYHPVQWVAPSGRGTPHLTIIPQACSSTSKRACTVDVTSRHWLDEGHASPLKMLRLLDYAQGTQTVWGVIEASVDGDIVRCLVSTMRVTHSHTHWKKMVKLNMYNCDIVTYSYRSSRSVSSSSLLSQAISALNPLGGLVIPKELVHFGYKYLWWNITITNPNLFIQQNVYSFILFILLVLLEWFFVECW